MPPTGATAMQDMGESLLDATPECVQGASTGETSCSTGSQKHAFADLADTKRRPREGNGDGFTFSDLSRPDN